MSPPISGAGVDTLIGGTGNDLFSVIRLSGRHHQTGRSGMNALRHDYVTDISQINISGMQTWQVHVGALTLTAHPLHQFSTINMVGNPLD